MKIDILANIKLDQKKLQKQFPTISNGIYAAVNDITIGNELKIYAGPWWKDPAQIEFLKEIVAS